MNAHLRNMATDKLLQEIEVLQRVQKKYPTTHPAWRVASERLSPRFMEMARRQQAGRL